MVREKMLSRFHSYINIVAHYSFLRISAVGMSIIIKWIDCDGVQLWAALLQQNMNLSIKQEVQQATVTTIAWKSDWLPRNNVKS